MECKRCGHIWAPKVDKPEFCPKCKQPKYDTPSYKKKLEAYEDVPTIITADKLDDVIEKIKVEERKTFKLD